MPSSLLPRRAALAFAAGLLALTATHAQTAVQLSGGFLNITAPSTNQSVKVEIRGGETRLFGFPGIADGQAYQGLLGVSLATGAGNDKVEFDIQSPFSFDIRINTGNGDSETLVKWEILPGATTPLANLEVRSGTGAVRKVILELESEATAASFQIDAGSPTELQTKVISSNTSDRLRVAFAGTSPKTQFEVTSAASSLDVDVRGGGTPAADDLIYKIVQTRPADVALNWSLDAGASDDKLDAIVSAPGSTVTQRGSVFGRAGNDFLRFETEAFSTVTGLTLNGGAGSDELAQVLKGRFQNSQTLQTLLLGGDGDDILILTTDTGIFGTGLPNDLFPIIDCGPGNDRFQAFGLIRSCEARL
jgi:hypothetical protein